MAPSEPRTATSNQYDETMKKMTGHPLWAVAYLQRVAPNLAQILGMDEPLQAHHVEAVIPGWVSRHPDPPDHLDTRCSDRQYIVRPFGRQVGLLVLLEFQSAPDPKMSVRMLQYLADMNEWAYEQGTYDRERREMPPVILGVIYTAKLDQGYVRDLPKFWQPDPACPYVLHNQADTIHRLYLNDGYRMSDADRAHARPRDLVSVLGHMETLREDALDLARALDRSPADVDAGAAARPWILRARSLVAHTQALLADHDPDPTFLDILWEWVAVAVEPVVRAIRLKRGLDPQDFLPINRSLQKMYDAAVVAEKILTGMEKRSRAEGHAEGRDQGRTEERVHGLVNIARVLGGLNSLDQQHYREQLGAVALAALPDVAAFSDYLQRHTAGPARATAARRVLDDVLAGNPPEL